jgi:hypothetical protein
MRIIVTQVSRAIIRAPKDKKGLNYVKKWGTKLRAERSNHGSRTARARAGEKELLTQVKPRQLIPSASMSPRREG